MAEYGNETKRVVFGESGKKLADFKIRLQYDGFKQGQFFNEIVSAYLEEDPDFMLFISSLKDRLAEQSQHRRRIAKRERAEAQEIKKDFALTDDEVESIFDLLERETGI